MWNDRGGYYGTRLNHQALWRSLLAADWIGATETHKYVIRCALHTGSGFMEFSGCLGGKLGKEIAIGNICHRAKNQIRSHKSLLINLKFPIY